VIYLDMQTVSYIIFGVFLVLILFPFLYKEHLYRECGGAHRVLGIFNTHTHKVNFIPCKVDGQFVTPPKNHKVKYSEDQKKIYGEWSGYILHYDKVNKCQYPNKPFVFKWLSIEVACCEWDEGNPEPKAHHDESPVITNQFMQALADTAEIVAKARTAEAMKEQAVEFERTMKETAKRGGGGGKILLIVIIAILIIGLATLGFMMYTKFGALGI
jgi:hypothetical protein